MNCDNCGHEIDDPVSTSECPECGEDLGVRVNFKSPVKREDDDG